MERIRENLIKESLMNIRFLAQSEYFNGIHIKDDIILEKEYEQGRFTNLPRVRYYLYYLEENVRKEVMPHSEKVDVFELTDCQYEPEYLYFTEIDDMLDGRQTFNIIKYNITDHTHTKIISLKDNMELYPDQKQIKIFILDDSNLIIQRATLKEFESGYKEFFNYSHLLFNFVKNKQIPISDENIAHNGIDYMFPFNETSCVMKTGNSLFKHNRHDRISKDEAPVESLYVINIQQFISDLQLEQPDLVLSAIDQSFYDATLIRSKKIDKYLIYSKYNYDKNDETVIFYNIETKENFTCINKTTKDHSLLKNATVIEGIPYMITENSSGTQFFNLISNEIDTTYTDEYKIRYINDTTIVSTFIEKSLFGKEKEYVTIHKYPSKRVIVQEKGQYIGAISSNNQTTYIFLK